MLKFLLCLCLGLLCASVLACDPPHECVAEGEYCSLSCTDEECELCYGGFGACIDNVCYEFPAGAPCTESCGSGISVDFLSYECVDHVCAPALYGKATGDSCSSASECYTGLCEGTCIGLATGENCTDTAECGVNAYCGYACVERTTTNGQYCSTSDECVDITSTCVNGPGGYPVCTQLASVPEGEECSDTPVCEDSLYCNAFFDRCSTPSQSSLDFCDYETTTCQSSNGSESCMCNVLTGESSCYANIASCQDEYVTYLTCLGEEGCSRSSQVYIEGSCARTHCLTQFFDYQNCKKASERALGVTNEACLPDLALEPPQPEVGQQCDSFVQFSNYFTEDIYLSIYSEREDVTRYTDVLPFRGVSAKLCSYPFEILFSIFSARTDKLIDTFSRTLKADYYYSYIIAYQPEGTTGGPATRQTSGSTVGVAGSIPLPKSSNLKENEFGFSFAHAAASGPGVDISIGGAVVGKNVNYPQVTPVKVVGSGAGSYPVVTETAGGGEVLRNRSISVETGKVYREVVYDTVDSTFESNTEDLGSPDEEGSEPLQESPTSGGKSTSVAAMMMSMF